MLAVVVGGVDVSVSYVYDGSFDGFLSAVFEAYANREEPDEIAERGFLQEMFGYSVREVVTDEAHARRVESGIVKTMGSPCYQKVWTAFLSGEPRKAGLLYRYVKRGFEIGRGIYHNIAHDHVIPIEKMCLNVEREAHLMKGFVRFSETVGGVFYSKIEPKNRIIPLLMPHFSDRMSIQPFIIYDAAHGIAGVYDLKDWYLVETDLLTVQPPGEEELNYRRMWKNFYDAVAIAERTNPKCRRTHMPMRFWPNMTEHGYVPSAKCRFDSLIAR